MKRILSMALACLALLSCNEELSYTKYEVLPPLVTAISPVEATIDTPITITGENLNNVTEVTIGSEIVEIMSKVSDSELIVYASSTGRSGNIEVFAADGSTSKSFESFTYQYVAPEFKESQLPSQAEMGGYIYISGSRLNVVEAVYFVVEKDDEPLFVEAQIDTKTSRDMVVRVPYVPSSEAHISLGYFDGSEVVSTARSAVTMNIVRNVPQVSTTAFPRTDVGLRITIEGSNIDKIETLTVGGFEAEISNQTASSLVFKVPSGDFVDGENRDNQIVISYFDGNETQVLSSDFIAYVPLVKFWEDVILGCQDKSVFTANFFNLEDGVLYDNSLYATKVDPIACQYINYSNSSTWDGTACLASNVPAVSQEEYDQASPYVFVTSQSSGSVFFYGPANSYSTIRNFYIDGTSTTVYGGTKASFAGTPVIYYRYLNPLISAERILANKVINKEISVINFDEFPIDYDQMTIAGVNLDENNGGTKPAAAIGHAPDTHGWAGGTAPALGQTIAPNSVIMVLYYDHNGYSTNSLSNNQDLMQHIKKIGFIHVKEFTFASTTNDTAKATASKAVVDILWQKYPNTTVE